MGISNSINALAFQYSSVARCGLGYFDVGGWDYHVGIMEEFDLFKLALVSICMLILLGGFEFTVFQRNLKEWYVWPWTYVCEC